VKKRALITGISGMDGSHLADFLLEKDYEVFGLERKFSQNKRKNIKHIEKEITFVSGDITKQDTIIKALNDCNPDEFYNLAAQSFVGESWNSPESTTAVNALGTLKILESIRQYKKSIKYYQASSSEMFGRLIDNPVHENTPFHPRSPYGVSKLYAHWITKNYRETYNMFNCSGILFNHESERRGLEFVTRKITNGVAKIHLGLSDHITLGNLESERDWGYAPDYVEAMWLMLQQDKPDDYVIATGKKHSIKDFLTIAFKEVGIDDWAKYVKQDHRFMRPTEIDVLVGSSQKAQVNLGWKPKTSFRDIVSIMVQSDIKNIKFNSSDQQLNI
jgi:GDPmannose 4,6-dehydratase